MKHSLKAVALVCVALIGCADSSRGDDAAVGAIAATGEDAPSRPVEMVAAEDVLSDSVPDDPSPNATEKILLQPAHWPEDLRESGRRPTSLQMRVRWSNVGTWDDTTFLHPTHAEVMPNSVIVQDIGRMSLMGLRREDGEVLWRKGRRGSGPGELLLGEISRATDSSVFYYDSGNRRITEWTSEGALLESRNVTMMGLLRGLCRLSNGELHAFTFPSGTIRGRGLARLVPDVDSLVDLIPVALGRPVHRTALDAQLKLYPLEGGSCALGAHDESWLAVFSDVATVSPLPLVEFVPPPIVIDTKEGKGTRTSFVPGQPFGVQAVAQLGSYLAVGFGGKTSVRRRLVDFYHLNPWRYEGSIVMPGTVRGLSARDSTLVIVSEDTSGFPRIDNFAVSVFTKACCNQ